MIGLSSLLLMPALLVGADAAASFRYESPIQAAPGWVVIELPDEVLDGCRPGLPDLRVIDANGKEVPFAIDPPLAQAQRRLLARDVELVPGSHTSALIDRGDNPGWADRMDLELSGANFLKPVTVESSEDRSSWAQMTRGSVFRTAAASSLSMRFAANDRRWWRVTLDDRNGPAVRLEAVTVHEPSRRGTPRELPLELRKDPAEGLDATTWMATLPAANLGASAVRIEATDPAYHRRVRVYERVLIRDEVDRVLLGEGTILRSRQVQDSIRVRPPSSRLLEIEVERSAGAELRVTGAKVQIEPRRIMFHAAPDASLKLAYGSPAVQSAGYDLESALSHGLPAEPKSGAVGPRIDTGALPAALEPPARGGVIDASGWERRQEIILPSSGTVAWLDLELPSDELASVRIVDSDGKQVPYIVESAHRARSREVAFQARHDGTRTILTINGIRALPSLSSVVLAANSPPYFQRRLWVTEMVEDRRGPMHERGLGQASWIKTPEEPFSPLRIPIERPSTDTLQITAENSDSAHIEIASVAVGWEVRRINFLFELGEKLALLSGNRGASNPRYDLVMVAGRLLSSPAQPASLQPAVQRAAAGGVPKWFWGFVVAAAVLVALALARTLKGEAAEKKEGG